MINYEAVEAVRLTISQKQRWAPAEMREAAISRVKVATQAPLKSYCAALSRA